MANSLLDFVMSLVRDPDAAARYAADPAQAIAAADLADVTSADVQNLIPMVSESLSMAVPSFGVDAFGAEAASNVWTSGAAATAFEAFADQVPEPPVMDTVLGPVMSTVMDTLTVVTDIADQPGSGIDDVAITDLDVLAGADLDVAAETGPAEDWVAPIGDPYPGDHPPVFDIFD